MRRVRSIVPRPRRLTTCWLALVPLGPGGRCCATSRLATAWWVGFYAIIRHRGVHHLTLAPVTDAVEVGVLESATRVVACGMATRTLEAWLRQAELDDGAARIAYCRAVTEAIIVERDIPMLLDALGELRLADLTASSVPWRGRFTKYESGAGAGQVE
jgi:hypothetical protein